MAGFLFYAERETLSSLSRTADDEIKPLDQRFSILARCVYFNLQNSPANMGVEVLILPRLGMPVLDHVI